MSDLINLAEPVFLEAVVESTLLFDLTKLEAVFTRLTPESAGLLFTSDS